MDQNKAYETVADIAVKAIERIDKVFTKEMNRREKAGEPAVDLARDYASSLAAAAALLSTSALLKPLSPFSAGFFAGMTKEECQ